MSVSNLKPRHKRATSPIGRCGVLRATLVLAIALGSNGCAFYFLDGYGPVSRSLVIQALPPESPDQLRQWKEEVAREFPTFAPVAGPNAPDAPGAKVYHKSDFYWPVLAGTCQQIGVSILPNDGTDPDERTVIRKDIETGVLAPVYHTSESVVYDLRSGMCLAIESSRSALLRLAHFHTIIKPHGRGFTTDAPECYIRSEGIERVAYDRMTSMSVGWGFLAAGTKNNRPYFQFAWIPIPLESQR